MEKNSRKVLAINLDRLMRERQLKQPDLAKLTKRFGGITQKTISNYLDQSHDSESNPTLSKVDTLACTLGLTAHELLNPALFSPVKSQVEPDMLELSIGEAVALLHEADILNDELSKIIMAAVKDISRATAIIYNGKVEDNSSRTVFDFMAYLKARQQAQP